MPTVIDALKRLERAGSEHSRTTEKLREAAETVSRLIVSAVPAGVTLPRNYQADREGNPILWKLAPADGWDAEMKDVPAGTLVYRWAPSGDVSRDHLHEFAADVAEGLLDEIAAFLETRAAENQAATERLEAAAISAALEF